MERVGLIGVGYIGLHFTRWLIQKSYPLVVLDRDPERVQSAVDMGATSASTPADVAHQSEIILLSLPGSPAVESVMEGEDGLLSALSEGQIVIDTGTSRPGTDIHYDRRVRELGAGFLDAPITWRSPGLICMVGGDEALYRRAMGVIETISYKHRHVGPMGQGQKLKLMNQIILAGQLAIHAETVAFCQAIDLDPQLLKEYLEFPISDALLTGDFSGTFTLALHYKDLLYALELGHEAGANIPLTSLVHEIFKLGAFQGDPSWSQPGILEYWKRLNPP
jgi:3-hydroxyisobutyrate dehydrogenase-like beta-hydroxyacid dehydrogenase